MRRLGGATLADDLDAIRRKLPEADADFEAVEKRCAGHEAEEAELTELGIDGYLDGADPAEVERRRIEFESRKSADLRELEQRRVAVHRLRERGADLAEEQVRAEETQLNDEIVELDHQRQVALMTAAKLERHAAEKGKERLALERRRVDARAEFDPRARRDWGHEDGQEVRRWLDLHLRGLAAQELTGPPEHLRDAIAEAVRKARDPERRAAEQRLETERLLAAGGYVRMPSPPDGPFPVPLNPER